MANWLQLDGQPVSCAEKIRMLNENLEEMTVFFQDILDDAVVMGCDPQMVKRVYQELIAGREPSL